MAVGYLGFELVQNAPLFIPGSSEGQWMTMAFLPARLLNTAFKRAGFFDFDLPEGARLTVLNAYPVMDGKRTLPVLSSWSRRNVAPGELDGSDNGIEFEVSYHDLSAYSKVASIALDEGGLIDLPDFGKGQSGLQHMFFVIEEDKDGEILNFHVPYMQVSPDLEQNQRPVTCLAPGNRFKGLVKIEASTDEALDAIARGLDQAKEELFIGRRRHVGFGGRMDIGWDSEILDREGAFFSDSELKHVKKGQIIRLIFLSRVVSPQGQGLKDVVLTTFGDTFRTIGVFTEQVRERHLADQGIVWKEGSVVVMTANEDMAVENIGVLEDKGIGLLTDEGYGRFMALKKAEEGIEYGYWMPQKGLGIKVTETDVRSALELRDQVVDTMVDRAADIYAGTLLRNGFGGRLPGIGLLIELYEKMRNAGLSGLLDSLDKLDAAQKQAMDAVRPGEGESLPGLLADLYKGRMNTTLGRDLDLDALSARKTPKGVRISKLAGKRKKALLDQAVNRIAAIVMTRLLQTALNQQAEG